MAYPFAGDLARLQEALAAVSAPGQAPIHVTSLCPNPRLRLLAVEWKGLAGVARGGEEEPPPTPGGELLVVWQAPDRAEALCRPASESDLLALKVAAEGLDPLETARQEGYGPWVVQSALRQALRVGLLLAPEPKLRRATAFARGGVPADRAYLTADSFTLQWHITQACDLRCKHCYDRSHRPTLGLAEGTRILDELLAFCRDRHVEGQVSFSGGNPLLHPDFLELYRAAHERGFTVGILGNPGPQEAIEEILAAGPLNFFQVSLEGLREHNDFIRGPGHFDRTLRFLDALRELGVYSMVMLTLTRENWREVVALGDVLRGRANVFHFNRLSPVGEGARLALPEREEYLSFLEDYRDAAATNPVLGFKENLLGLFLGEDDRSRFGGCTGHGCGAAFNFVSLLADGEVHACRKFPSPIGSVLTQSLAEIYDSEAARRYRAGSSACAGCDLRPRCGGCLAVTSGLGLDPFTARDPFCPKQP